MIMTLFLLISMISTGALTVRNHSPENSTSATLLDCSRPTLHHSHGSTTMILMEPFVIYKQISTRREISSDSISTIPLTVAHTFMTDGLMLRPPSHQMVLHILHRATQEQMERLGSSTPRNNSTTKMIHTTMESMVPLHSTIIMIHKMSTHSLRHTRATNLCSSIMIQRAQPVNS
jgi:hypothetical protein